MYLLKMLGYHLIPGQKVAHIPRHKSSQSRPCWVVEALHLGRCVFLMSSEIFQLRNPGKLYLILQFKWGQFEHLEELTVCSQVGWTV